MPPRARPLSDQDRDAWAVYAHHVRPFAGRQIPAPPPSPKAATAPSKPAPAPAPATKRAHKPPPLTTGLHPPGLDKATWNRLRGGKLPAARTLDLHGKTAQSAFHALQRFLIAAHADHLRCVEIITGRGAGEQGGVLRRELPLWLNLPALRPLVLATTHPHITNPGSTLVLLRRQK